MTRDELIEKIEAPTIYEPNEASAWEFGYKHAFNSELFKDLQELAVIEALITNNKGILNFDMPDDTKGWFVKIIEAQERMRKTLLTKLNLEG